jgi:predicted small secreted protein
MRKFLSGLLIVAALTALPACNMVRGAGEDLQSAADTVDRET